MPRTSNSNTPRALYLIPLAALLTILPLILHGGSCGHDEVFHVQGWLDAAAQLRHLIYPHWSTTSAWSAGEPRFLFYPPLSWLLGALFTLILPPQAAVYAYIFLCLTLSGFTMYRLAAHFTSPNAALLAAVLYLANPYMLFNAFERTAFAELLAAAWVPLLLLAVLRTRPTVRSIAIPLALLWLTNAPAAVMASYTFALLATLRVAQSLFATIRYPNPSASVLASPKQIRYPNPSTSVLASPEQIRYPEASASVLASPEQIGYPEASASGLIAPQKARGFSPWGMPSSDSPLHLALTYIAATALGLALPAFFLIPAAYEQRFIQTSMALVTNMRIQDNFFFHHTLDSGHNGVNLQISLLGITLLTLTLIAVATLLILHLRSNRNPPSTAPASTAPSASDTPSRAVASSVSIASSGTVASSGTIRYPEASASGLIAQLKERALAPGVCLYPPSPTLALAALTLALTLMFLPISLPLWDHIPELAFLQFPWRLLTILSAVLTFTLALILHHLSRSNEPVAPCLTHPVHGISGSSQNSSAFRLSFLLPVSCFLLPAILGFIAFHLYAQFCQPNDRPPAVAQLLRTHHGFAPTDEYTPLNADSDVLRTSNPAYWLAPANAPNTPAPNTLPTPSELDPTLQSDDTPVPPEHAISYPAPTHLILTLPHPETLILNLRDYPAWQLHLTTPTATTSPSHLQRDDGLLAIPLPAGPSTLDIAWHTTPDQRLGLIVSLLALLILLTLYFLTPDP